MKRHKPRAGRIAFICSHKDHERQGFTPRRFVSPDAPVPRCGQHGSMELQRNTPYLGQPIPTPGD